MYFCNTGMYDDAHVYVDVVLYLLLKQSKMKIVKCLSIYLSFSTMLNLNVSFLRARATRASFDAIHHILCKLILLWVPVE